MNFRSIWILYIMYWNNLHLCDNHWYHRNLENPILLTEYWWKSRKGSIHYTYRVSYIPRDSIHYKTATLERIIDINNFHKNYLTLSSMSDLFKRPYSVWTNILNYFHFTWAILKKRRKSYPRVANFANSGKSHTDSLRFIFYRIEAISRKISSLWWTELNKIL